MDIAEQGRHGQTLMRDGRVNEAEAVFREVLRAAPQSAAARYGLATALLNRGDDREGWRLYDARLSIPEIAPRIPKLDYPFWRGEAVGSLLVWPEQGFGDQIMFARWIPLLVARGVRVTLLVKPQMARLFAGLGAALIVMAGEVRIPRHDAWTFMGSLPGLLGAAPADPYLAGAPGGAGVGVMPQGNPGHHNDHNRSMGEPFASELKTLGRWLAPEATGAADFEDTRRLVAGLACVAAVDTSAAHLAGAMGKPVLILLPHVAEWRWGQSGERSVWYPSARLIRQPAPGNWGAVLDRVRALIGVG